MSRLDDHAGFHNTLVRINCQFDYSLFGITHAPGFISGKSGYLFEEDYIHEYKGTFFIGEKVVDRKVRMLKNIQDSLGSYGVPLVVVYEPGKASFYPEYFPSRFRNKKKGPSNYDRFVTASAAAGLKFIDLNSWFLSMKDTSRFPLFPKYGMHWSLYGVSKAMDTLVSYLTGTCRLTLPACRKTGFTAFTNSPGTDYDIGSILNLLWHLPQISGGAAVVKFEDDSGRRNLRVLIIADSYYLNILEPYGRKLFRSQEYRYYNKKLYPRHNVTPPQYADKSDMRNKLKKFDLVLLMSSEINLHSTFWNFPDEAFYAFHPWPPQPALERIENDIRNDREWFRFMVAKSRSTGRPLEEMISEDAQFMFFSTFADIPAKSYLDTIDYIGMEIRRNGDWLAAVQKKAQDNHLSLDSMIRVDATYTYMQKRQKKW